MKNTIKILSLAAIVVSLLTFGCNTKETIHVFKDMPTTITIVDYVSNTELEVNGQIIPIRNDHTAVTLPAGIKSLIIKGKHVTTKNDIGFIADVDRQPTLWEKNQGAEVVQIPVIRIATGV